MRVLVVWESIPETIDLYILEGEAAATALSAHNCYVNAAGDKADEAAAVALSNLLVNYPALIKVEPIDLTGANIDKVVLSGFIM